MSTRGRSTFLRRILGALGTEVQPGHLGDETGRRRATGVAGRATGVCVGSSDLEWIFAQKGTWIERYE